MSVVRASPGLTRRNHTDGDAPPARAATVLQLDKECLLARVRTMSKVTAKLQITLPKRLADRFAIHPGDDIQWKAAHDAIHIIPPSSQARQLEVAERLELFDQATERQRARQARSHAAGRAADRGWTRDQLYDRRRAR